MKKLFNVMTSGLVLFASLGQTFICAEDVPNTNQAETLLKDLSAAFKQMIRDEIKTSETAIDIIKSLSPEQRKKVLFETAPFEAWAGHLLKPAAKTLFFGFTCVCLYKIMNKVHNHYSTRNISTPDVDDTTQDAPTGGFETLAGTLSQEILDIVEYIKKPSKLKKFGVKPINGVLLYGPPGNGKTHTVRAIAAEAKANFFFLSATECLIHYHGAGEAKIRNVFEQARQANESGPYKKSIIFIDEIDTFGTKRSGSDSPVSVWNRSLINELLAQMDGFNKNKNITVIAATNTVEDLDKALIRPGRFDRIVHVGNPDYENRIALIKFYSKNKPTTLTDDDIALLATNSEGLSKAEMENIVNEAAVAAMRENADAITLDHYTKALNTVTQAKLSADGYKYDKNEEIPQDGTAQGFQALAGTIEQDVLDAVEFIKEPAKLEKFDIKPPKGYLLYGPPGNGKTHTVRAIAVETEASFFSVSASEFMLPLIGTGEIAIRNLFDKARKSIKSGKYKKSIIFIDEIDTIGTKRNGSNLTRNFLNELLTQMDGFKQDSNIIVMAATNTVEDLDPALTRPGRFDRIIRIDNPDYENRIALIKFYSKNKPTTLTDEDIALLATNSEGLSKAEMKNIVNEAAVAAMRANADSITLDHYTKALQKTLQTKLVTNADRLITKNAHVDHRAQAIKHAQALKESLQAQLA